MIPWGQASDRVGRKPILIISLIGVGLTTGLLGFGQTIWQLIVFRCLAGFFAATIVLVIFPVILTRCWRCKSTVRTMISENSTPKTQARAFGYFTVSGNIGILVGPLIGMCGLDKKPSSCWQTLSRWRPLWTSQTVSLCVWWYQVLRRFSFCITYNMYRILWT